MVNERCFTEYAEIHVVQSSAEWGCVQIGWRLFRAVVATHRHSGEIVAFLIVVTQSRRDVIGVPVFVTGPPVHDEQKNQDEAREREEVSSGRDRQ